MQLSITSRLGDGEYQSDSDRSQPQINQSTVVPEGNDLSDRRTIETSDFPRDYVGCRHLALDPVPYQNHL